MKSLLSALWDGLTSFRLTLICLVAALLLVFAGTLAQVQFGTHEVQMRYFQSLFVWWWPFGPEGAKFPVFPGGHLIGGVLLVNLIAAHIRRFRLSWRHFGLHLIHAGVVVMLAGGLFTDLFSVESHMQIAEGETMNYSVDARRTELAIIDTGDPAVEQVTAIPDDRLRAGGAIVHESLPFRIVVKKFFRNSRLAMPGDSGTGAEPAADNGIGARVAVEEQPRATSMNERDRTSAVIEIVTLPGPDGQAGKSLGTWLVSDALGRPQVFSLADRTWNIVLRPMRHYHPYSITLRNFTHERYPGTGIPKNFSSDIRLIDPEESVDREVLIYMNHPLRYRGDTYYQSGFGENDTTSILQVVHNPTFLAPYVGCVIVGIGLLVQFLLHLVKFARRRRSVSAP